MTDLRPAPGRDTDAPGVLTVPIDPTVPFGARSPAENVVLLDDLGRPIGSEPKSTVHHRHTPLHLGFSCHVVDRDGRVLVTQRAHTKQTWPGAWSNACCGHPGPCEALGDAVARRLRDELGVRARRMGLAIPDFVYRAGMAGGRTEHELCPVVVAQVDEPPRPHPGEVADVAWVEWDALVARATERPSTLSPWAVMQIRELARLAPSPAAWLDAHTGDGRGSAGRLGLDRPPAMGPAPARPDRSAGGGALDPVDAVRTGVDAVIDGFLADREREVRGVDPVVLEVAGEVRSLVAAGGKRLRPAFVYWGHRAVSATPDDGVLVAAAAIEMLHTFALLHDDVMDRSRHRRGRPAAHVALSRLHREQGLTGDGHWFGTSAAMLAGDLSFVWADQLFDSTPLPPAAVEAGRRVFTQLRTEVIGGQYLDLRLAHDPDGDEEVARRVALLKSARYTVTRPLLLGAALAGHGVDPASAPTIAALSAYGDAVGLAFQMRDDVLGLFGDPATTGKDGIDDLREGKRTLLVLRALRLTTGPDNRFLRRSLGDPALDAAAARRCRAIVAASGARASVEALIDAELSRALDAIAELDDPARQALTRLAAMAAHRGR
ncbi:MAG TPA: isopentenyl-diphosphate Delta-isomerase [Acidimicrobiales bacterium]